MPFHEGVATALAAALKTTGRVGPALVARVPLFIIARISIPLGRTVGFLSNRLEPNRPTLLEAFGRRDWFQIINRLTQLAPFSPYGPLGLGLDFWRGAAYPDFTELVEGWSSAIIEIGVPGTDLNRLFRAVQERDIEGVLDPGLDKLYEAIGLESVEAALRGFDSVAKSITGTKPLEALAGAISGFFAWFGGLFEKGLDLAKPLLPEEAEEEGDEGSDTIGGGAGAEEFKDVYEEAVTRTVRGLRRIRRTSLGQRIIGLLKEEAKKRPTPAGLFEKVLRVIETL